MNIELLNKLDELNILVNQNYNRLNNEDNLTQEDEWTFSKLIQAKKLLDVVEYLLVD